MREAVAHVLGDVSKLCYLAFTSRPTPCGSLDEWLAAAPRAEAVCSVIAAQVSVEDLAERPPRALADAEELNLGARRVRWLDAPHLPHDWECGYLFESTATFACHVFRG